MMDESKAKQLRLDIGYQYYHHELKLKVNWNVLVGWKIEHGLKLKHLDQDVGLVWKGEMS